MSSSNSPIYKEKTTTCNWCGSAITGLRDKKSEREFKISGLCQECQDKTFNQKSKLSKATIEELRKILKEEFNHELDNNDLTKFAHVLVGYFDLLLRVDSRHKFQNRPDLVIDHKEKTVLNEKEVK